MTDRIKKITRYAALMTCAVVFAVVRPVIARAEVEEWPVLSDNGLPVVCITIDETAEDFGTIDEMNSSPDHSVRCTGTVRVTVPAGYRGDYSKEPLTDTDELALEYIRGRGNTTWFFAENKRPYKFKLDKKADLLGMGKNKHWILLANDNDETLLRNRLISYMGEAIGLAYTPKMLPVDVVMNGKYLGSYTLTEQVRVGETRVNIDEPGPEDNEEPEVTGGYLLALHPGKDGKNPEENCFYTRAKAGFSFDTPVFFSDDPSEELGTEAQRAYIESYLQKTEDAAFSGDPWEYMDRQSAADYWWIQEYSLNVDSFKTDSTYLYKERNGKLFWGPLWDFDLSLGKTIADTDGFNHSRMPWLDHLRNTDPEYVVYLKERWQVLDGILEDILKKGGVLDEYAGQIRASWENNRPLTMATYNEFDQKIEDLRRWMTERRDWINGNLELLPSTEVTVSFTALGDVFHTAKLPTGYPLSGIPEVPEIDGYFFVNWELDGEPMNAFETPHIYEDCEVKAVFVKNEDVIHIDNIFFENSDVWADIDQGGCYQGIFIAPENAQDRMVTWTSSDEAVATVDEYGSATFAGTGEAVITATDSTGKTFSYTLHIYDGSEVEIPEPESLTLERTEIRLKTGEYAQVVPVLSPLPSRRELSYDCDSGADEILEMFDSGVFRAIAPGEATIRVYAAKLLSSDANEGDELDYQILEATCKIIVTDDADPAGDTGVAGTLLLILAASAAVCVMLGRSDSRNKV